MASRSDKTRSHGSDGKGRKHSNPIAGSEFIQRYSQEEYSRALPTSVIPKAKPRLGEYCVPVDSKPTQKQPSLDRSDFPADPDNGYALPQDSLVSSNTSSTSQVDEDDDGLVYELAQQPLQEYPSPPSSKPSPLPRTSLRENEKSPQHEQNSKLTSQHRKGAKDDTNNSASEYNLASACFTENSDSASTERKRPSKKVVEIEYEAVSDLRPYRPNGSESVQRKQSLEKPDQSISINKSITNSVKTEATSNQPLTGTQHATSSSVYSFQQETVYDEPWDLKAKRLKEEQEKKGSERKLGLVKIESKIVPDMRSDVYEEAWDTAAQQRKLEKRLNLVRTKSQSSEAGDVYHDAFESLPEQKKPQMEYKKEAALAHVESKKDSHHQKPSPSKHDSQTQHHKYSHSHPDKPPQPPETPAPPLQPLPADIYEDAWDLKNVILEEKIRQMQIQASATYEEPWESSKQHKALQAQFNRSQSAFTEKPVLPAVPRSSSDARDHTANAARAHYNKAKHYSTDDPRAKLKGRGPNIGQRINPMVPLSHQNWFHGNISRDDAEQMLCVCKEGSYIVRISSDRKSYSLSIKSAKQYIHVQIEQVVQPDGSLRYILGKNSKEFCTIPEMIDHYTHHRVPLKGAEHITLLHPVECKWSQQS